MLSPPLSIVLSVVCITYLLLVAVVRSFLPSDCICVSVVELGGLVQRVLSWLVAFSLTSWASVLFRFVCLFLEHLLPMWLVLFLHLSLGIAFWRLPQPNYLTLCF